MDETMIARKTTTHENCPIKMVGIARTVQLTDPNDFLAVLQGLDEAQPGEVLCVNTKGSTKAVAGGLFCQEAQRKNLSGIIIDGPIRDISSIQKGNIPCFSTSVTPYSGTIKSAGVVQAEEVKCGGVDVSPGDLIVGDCDGLVVGSIDTMEALIHVAENITSIERDLMIGMDKGLSLHSMTNYINHLAKIREGKDSSLEFVLKK